MLSISIGAPSLASDPSVLITLTILGGTALFCALVSAVELGVSLVSSIFGDSGSRPS